MRGGLGALPAGGPERPRNCLMQNMFLTPPTTGGRRMLAPVPETCSDHQGHDYENDLKIQMTHAPGPSELPSCLGHAAMADCQGVHNQVP